MPSTPQNAEPRKSILGLRDHDADVCLFNQIFCISLFYATNIFIDTMLYWLGQDAIQAGEIICAQ